MDYKRILTIQDISCVGQCSMTVALPILSACGMETCVLPTALLSTHTGGFGKPAVVHFDDSLDAIRKHWKENNITFDAILTGYLGSASAVRAAEAIVSEMLAPGGIAIVDPAMADHGRMYSGLSGEYADAIARLCRKADILLPNITEAAMLSGLPYRENLDAVYVEDLLKSMGHPCVIMTGVGFTPEKTGAAIWAGERCEYILHERIGGNCHGTGDIFAATFTGALMRGKDLRQAAGVAAKFTCRCIENTQENPAHWYGVKFEPVLPELMNMLKEAAE